MKSTPKLLLLTFSAFLLFEAQGAIEENEVRAHADFHKTAREIKKRKQNPEEFARKFAKEREATIKEMRAEMLSVPPSYEQRIKEELVLKSEKENSSPSSVIKNPSKVSKLFKGFMIATALGAVIALLYRKMKTPKTN